MSKKIVSFVAGLLIAITLGVSAGPLFQYFGPATGILVGNASTPVTSAATWGNISSLLSGSCSSGNVILYGGTCGTGSGSGSVTSVGLSAPSVFSVSGSPVTSSGTLALSFATGQTANEVLASPNGSTGVVGLRALVGADIPAINLTSSGNGGVTGTLAVTNGGDGLATATLGDIRYASASNTLSALAGNTTTTKKFLSQTGTGSVSAAPTWGTLATSDVLAGFTGTCSSSTYLNGAGACASPVTSVALSAPSIFTVSGSPVTSTGTLTLSYSGTALPIANGGTALTAVPGSSGQVLFNSSSAYAAAANLTYSSSSGVSIAAPSSVVAALSVTGISTSAAESLTCSGTYSNGCLSINNSTSTATNSGIGFLSGGTLYGTIFSNSSGGMQYTVSTSSSSNNHSFYAYDTSAAATVEALRVGTVTGAISYGTVQAREDSYGVAALALVATTNSGSFTATGVAGFSSSPTATWNYTRSGNQACIEAPNALTGTSNATNFQVSGLPSIIYPAHNQIVMTRVEDNGSTDYPGWVYIPTSGYLQFAKYSGSTFSINGFTASGTKGISGSEVFCYALQ